jgi:hypothetical protein
LFFFFFFFSVVEDEDEDDDDVGTAYFKLLFAKDGTVAIDKSCILSIMSTLFQILYT